MSIDRLHSAGRWAPILETASNTLHVPIDSGHAPFSVDLLVTEEQIARLRGAEAFYWAFYAKVWKPSQDAGALGAGEVMETVLADCMTHTDEDLVANLTEEERHLMKILSAS